MKYGNVFNGSFGHTSPYVIIYSYISGLSILGLSVPEGGKCNSANLLSIIFIYTMELIFRRFGLI